MTEGSDTGYERAADEGPRSPLTEHPIVVLGGGYAGLTAVRGLTARLREPAKVLLVDQSPDHELVVQLHEAATGAVSLDRLRLPFTEVSGGASLLTARVTGIDVNASRVSTDAGDLQYRWLVIALGSVSNRVAVPGAAEHALPLRRLADAEQLHARLTDLEHTAASQATRTLVIAGGGPTGVQLAGELAAWVDQRSTPSEWRLVLLEAQDRLLPRFGPAIGRAALDELRRNGVEVLLGAPVERVERDGVILAAGDRLPAGVIAWGGGVALPDFLRDLPRRFGGLETNGFLRLTGTRNVFVAGDCLSVNDSKGRPLPPSAQLAVDAGRVVADNVILAAQDQPLRVYKPAYLGETVSLGRRAAVARVGPATVTGLAGLAVRRFTEERYIEGIGGLKLLQEWSGDL